MARSKEFETKPALAAAMNAFWRHGYRNTSFDVLTRETGVAKQSLYDTFGDKRALYFKAMAFYREETNSSMRRILNASPSAKQGFAKLFDSLIGESREEHERGCLLLSANMERAVDDEEIARFLGDNQAEVEAIFVERLRRAQANGELAAEQNVETLAKFFVVTLQGMRAMARLKSDRRALRQVAKFALAALDRA